MSELTSDEQLAQIVRMRTLGEFNEDIGKALGVSESTVRRRLTSVGLGGPLSPENGASPKLGGDAKDREIVGLRDEIGRLNKELKNAHREALSEEKVKDILGTLAAAPVSPPKWTIKPTPKKDQRTPQVPITSWGDWHNGEVVSREQVNGINEFNPEICEQRVKRLVERTINLCREHGPGVYPGIVVNLGGDFVSGRLHPELVKTDDGSVLQAVLRVVDLLVWGLEKLADEFGHVYAPAVAGNHGRNTTRPEYKDYIYDNFDWLIYQMVIRAFKDRGDDRVKIDVRPANEVAYSVYGHRYVTMHGDMIGARGGDGIIGAIGPITRGEVKVRGYADSVGIPYDTLVLFHWHQPLWLPRAFVANSLKGYCEYAKNALRAPPTEPSQPLWFQHPLTGITSKWEIWLNEFTVKEEKPWVAVFDPV